MKDKNENRPGYKKTKVGWIPEGWESPRIEEICGMKSGQSITSISISRNAQYPCFGGNGLRGYTSKFTHDGQYILIGRQCALSGNVHIVADKFFASEHAIVVTVSPKSSLFWLAELLNYKQLNRYTEASAQPGLSVNKILRIRVPLPPLPEQKKIAEILSTWDEAIEQTRSLIKAKKKRKKGLMQQLLTGKTRLPGFATSASRIKYKYYDLPVDWECVQIKDVAQERVIRNNENRKIVVYACSKYQGFVKSLEYFDRQIYSKDTSAYKFVKNNWFGFPANHIEEGSIGLFTDNIGIVSPIYIVFSMNKSVYPSYMYAVYKTMTYKHIFSVSTNASVNRRGSLRWNNFSLIRIPLPPLPEQKAIAEVLTTADDEIALLEETLSFYEKQKRGLMQKLLTGEVRVFDVS